MLFDKLKTNKNQKDVKSRAQLVVHIDADKMAALDAIAGPRGRSELVRNAIDCLVAEKSELPSVKEQAFRTLSRLLSATARQLLSSQSQATGQTELQIALELIERSASSQPGGNGL